MTTTNSIKKTAVRIATTLCIAAVTATASFAVEDGKCLFSERLKEPYYKAEYQAIIAYYKNPASYQYAEGVEQMYSNTSKVSFTENATWRDMDAMSFDCMTCHDGMTAKSHDVRIKNNPADRSISLINVVGTHPVGMHYESYAGMNKELVPMENLNKDMVFVNGKMGCLTCHNPLNPKKNHLVMNNTGSTLCFSCHNK